MAQWTADLTAIYADGTVRGAEALKWPMWTADGFYKPVQTNAFLDVEELSTSSIRLTWRPFAADLGNPQSYNVYQNGVLVQNVPDFAATISGLVLGTTYVFLVIAVLGGVQVRETLPARWQHSSFSVSTVTIMPQARWWRATDPPFLR